MSSLGNADDKALLQAGTMLISARQAKMKVAKWGNSLAVRLPADLVRKLDLKEGDRVEIIAGNGALEVRRQPRAEEVLEALRRFRGRLPASARLGRDAAHER